MDFNMKQWRDHQQDSEEEQPSSKIPRQQLLHQSPQQQVSALPLFVSQPNKITNNLSDFPDYSSIPTALPTNSPRFSKMGGGYCFSLAQWQELEVQAVIFKHMMAGVAVPPELLLLVKKSLLTSPYYHLHHGAFLQGGYWGKGSMDPEPGRCRRTDGKKWRCSRDVVVGHKYCERHMNRGRNRSRKLVEVQASTGANNVAAAVAAGGLAIKSSSTAFSGGSSGSAGGRGSGGGSQFMFSNGGVSSLEAFQLHQGASKHDDTHSKDSKSNKVLMHFFDDFQEPSANANANANGDFLRLSTGNVDELGQVSDRERVQLGWASNASGPMGGPLAEALRSSTNSSSPTSVLHQLPHCSASGSSFANC